MATKQPSEAQLLDSLGIRSPARRRTKWLIALVVVVAAGGVVFAWVKGTAEPPPAWRTAEASLADLELTVTATGTLAGVDTVDVGTEVSGRVVEVLVDFNESVKAGQVLARIDPEQLEARLEEATAQLSASQASVRNAQATEHESQVKLERVQRLVERGLLAKQELDTALAAAQRAQASVASSLAQQTVARASLRAARTNAGRADVRAPIDGIVLSRAVEPGQTVAASFQAPVLFTLARDLTRLTLSVDIDEADVGRVKEGQRASFEVSAWPQRRFESKVLSVRNVPKTSSGAASTVVTYEAVLAVDNADEALRPGMTATATIVTERREQVLTVPSAALRFTPTDAIAARNSGIRMFGMPPVGGGARPAGGGRPKPARALWTLSGAGAAPTRVEVEVGASDGRRSEITSGLSAGAVVVIDQIIDAGAAK